MCARVRVYGGMGVGGVLVRPIPQKQAFPLPAIPCSPELRSLICAMVACCAGLLCWPVMWWSRAVLWCLSSGIVLSVMALLSVRGEAMTGGRRNPRPVITPGPHPRPSLLSLAVSSRSISSALRSVLSSVSTLSVQRATDFPRSSKALTFAPSCVF